MPQVSGYFEQILQAQINSLQVDPESAIQLSHWGLFEGDTQCQ